MNSPRFEHVYQNTNQNKNARREEAVDYSEEQCGDGMPIPVTRRRLFVGTGMAVTSAEKSPMPADSTKPVDMIYEAVDPVVHIRGDSSETLVEKLEETPTSSKTSTVVTSGKQLQSNIPKLSTITTTITTTRGEASISSSGKKSSPIQITATTTAEIHEDSVLMFPILSFNNFSNVSNCNDLHDAAVNNVLKCMKQSQSNVNVQVPPMRSIQGGGGGGVRTVKAGPILEENYSEPIMINNATSVTDLELLHEPKPPQSKSILKKSVKPTCCCNHIETQTIQQEQPKSKTESARPGEMHVFVPPPRLDKEDESNCIKCMACWNSFCDCAVS